jgi:hypothetical protein
MKEKGYINIDQLFGSRLKDHTFEPDPEQWDRLSMSLDRMRFFRFGFRHFNIYYSILIGITTAFFLFMVIYSLLKKN